MRLHYLIGFTAAFGLAAALGTYMLFEAVRLEDAQSALLARQVSDGQVYYAENCAVCHGAAGEGLGANPPLDSAGLRDMDYATLYKVIARGRYETAMPAWSLTDGGPLNDAQIEALIALIQHGDWAVTQMIVADLGLAPRVPVSVTVPAETLALIAALPEGNRLADGVQVYAAECVACHGANGTGTTLAPALNSDQLRAERSAAQLTNAIQFGVAGTVMPAWDQTLTAEQIASLVLLVQRWGDLPPDAIPAPPAQPIIVTEQLLATGASLYAQSCARCHGTEGQGTRRAPALDVQTFFEKYTADAALIQVITQGVPGTAMPAWGDRLSEREIEGIVAFIRSWEPTAPAVAVPQTTGAGGPPWQRSNAAPNPQPLAQTGAASHAGQTAAASLPPVDWRVAALVGLPGAVAVSTLVGSALALRRLRTL